jgi:REP element-mobilizing transposase RayT
MVIARRDLILEDKVSCYHVITRVVRKARLLGTDLLTGKNYDHRKIWFKNRLTFLAKQFSIEVCDYSLMESHTHLLIRNRPDLVQEWSAQDVALRWWRLFPKRFDHFGNPAEPKDEELDQVLFDPETGNPEGRLKLLRKRLASISWFMRCLNEYIARRANREDKCTGRFWEGRFKSIELLDQGAVLACMAYIDLNPIHAGLAQTPEESNFTSAQDRIVTRISKKKLAKLRSVFHQANKAGNTEKPQNLDGIMAGLELEQKRDSWLSPMYKMASDKPVVGYGSFLNMDVTDYLEILDWTGKQNRADKPGVIPGHLEPLLTRMDIEVSVWLETVTQFNNWFHRVAGRLENFAAAARVRGKRWLAGKSSAKTAFL